MLLDIKFTKKLRKGGFHYMAEDRGFLGNFFDDDAILWFIILFLLLFFNNRRGYGT